PSRRFGSSFPFVSSQRCRRPFSLTCSDAIHLAQGEVVISQAGPAIGKLAVDLPVPTSTRARFLSSAQTAIVFPLASMAMEPWPLNLNCSNCLPVNGSHRNTAAALPLMSWTCLPVLTNVKAPTVPPGPSSLLTSFAFVQSQRRMVRSADPL